MDQKLFDITDKVALVTGASSGIGRHLAITLAKAGAKVVLLGRRKSKLLQAESAINEQGGSAASVAADLFDKRVVSEIAHETTRCFGDIDILVHGAGVNFREHVDDITLGSWDRTMDLNLATPFFLSREFVPGMRHKAWGRIINIASLQSSRAFENGLAYGASKGGVAQLTRAMAEVWSKDGINCNAIAPGFFPTELTAQVFEDAEMVHKLAQQTAIGRNGQLDDLNGVCLFLASAASDYITGQVIYVDGGFTAK